MQRCASTIKNEQMAKQVCDCRGTKGISQGESDEQQRRWSDRQWNNRMKNEKLNYDITRRELNFEVVTGGKIQAIDSSASIDQKIREACASRGMRYPNDPNPRRKPGDETAKIKERNVAAQFIFGGGRERMHELAFGSYGAVDLARSADNSHVQRRPEIEQWALDTYRFLADRYGEENVISFYVHLDETNPHCHATVLPVADIKGKKRVSWNSLFGGRSREESAAKFRAIHDDYYSQVGSKWGLERGDAISETGAKHRSLREWQADMQRDVFMARQAVKGLTTMIGNLTSRRDSLQDQLDMLGRGATAKKDVLSGLQAELQAINGKLADKREKLEEAERQLADARSQLSGLDRDRDEMRRSIDSLNDQLWKTRNDGAEIAKSFVGAACLEDAVREYSSILPKLSRYEQPKFDGSVMDDLATKGQNVMICATLLFLGALDEATNFAQSHGGGDGSGLPWGRDPNEDDRMWALRCARQARKMLKPVQHYRMRR